MRKINKVIIHCSASDNPNQDCIEAVRYLHTASKDTPIIWGQYETHGKAWNDVGYHFFIQKNGLLELGRKTDVVGAHCAGHNNDSIGVCFSGDQNIPNRAQIETYKMLKDVLKSCFDLSDNDFYPHNHFNKHKTCPNFKLR